jgi:hypothetical protein
VHNDQTSQINQVKENRDVCLKVPHKRAQIFCGNIGSLILYSYTFLTVDNSSYRGCVAPLSCANAQHFRPALSI